MLSLERRDARKELGIGGGGREMMMEEDTELEEGEACSYHSPNNDDDDEDCDVTMDPDVTLSYIDEKLQHVLGHFQKDFEGGVSAENLGAKFGGYGSFLSSQRSPVWSHPRTPPNVQLCSNLPKSPNTLQYGAGRRSSDSSGAPRAVRPGPTSASAVSLPSTKMPALTVAPLKQERRMSSAHISEEAIGRETLTKKSDSLPDPKMLKFRIKVGSDNLSAQTNDALYSGLGLTVSPSSSMEDSPSESEGMSHELHHASLESPAHIIQIMTSFPVHGGLLLSPLPDFLICLTEKERIPRDVGSISVSKLSKKMLSQEQMKSLERCELSSESKNDYRKVSESDIEIASRKEMVLDSLACDRLVSHTLRLPLLSSSYPTTGEMVKGLGMASKSLKEVCKDGVQENAVLGTEKVPFIPMASQEDGCIKNPKATTVREDWEGKKDGSLDSASECSRKGGARKRGKSSDSARIDASISKAGKALRAESTESMKHKAGQKVTSQKFEDEKLITSKECLPSEGKKKPKKSQSHGNVVAEISKAGSSIGPYSAARSRKDSHVDDSTEGELEDLKVQKTVGKSGDRYRDFFGDMELEQEDNNLSPLEPSRGDRVKGSRVVEKETHGINNSLIERSSGNKIDKMLASEAYSKPGSSAALRPQSVSALDAAPVTTDPVVTEDDHWVCCDKCQTWRLLPFGKNPDNLPDKWLCEMLDWLPGMNRCVFTEEETTEALFALYRAAAPNGQSGPAGPMTEGLRGVRTHEAIAASRKKKQGLREPLNITNKDCPIQLPNSAKKAVVTSVPNGSISEVSRSPRISDPDLLKSSKSSDTAMGKQKPNLKEKHKVHDNFSDGGDARQSKMRGKRASDEDLVRVSKKVKAGDLSEDPMSEYVVEKVGHSIPSGKLLPKDTDRTSSKDSKNDQKDQKKVSAQNPKDEVQVTLDVRSIDKRKHKDGEIMKKRKANQDFDANLRPSSPVGTELQLLDGEMIAKEEFSDSDFRKEKKARLSSSMGKEPNAGKGDGRTEKKGSHGRKQQSRQELGSTLSQRSLDGVECLKKHSGNRHPPVAATSSSSKVSGSHRMKGNILDTKGSPVESVSSLPVGTPIADKLVSAAGNTERHVNRKCSDGEDEGFGDRCGKGKKDKTIDLGHHESLEPSYIEFPEKDFGQVLPCSKAKQHSVPTINSTNQKITSVTTDSSDKDTQRHSRSENLDKNHNDERPNGNHSQSNGSRSRKSTKGSSSSRSKDRSFDTSLDNGKPRVSDSTTAHAASMEVKLGDSKNKADEKNGVKSAKKESRYIDKSSAGRSLVGNGKTDARSNSGGHNGPGDKGLAINTDDTKLSFPLEGQMNSGKEKAISATPCGVIQEEKSLSVPGMQKGNGGKVLSVGTSGSDNPSKAQKQTRKVDHPPNGINHSSGNQLSNGHRIRDHDAPSPVKRDSSSQAANNALKEAKNLKHLADRLKNSGSVQESTRLYFEASLKFLHGASLLESGTNENAKTDMIQSMQIYTSTAKLCEFCAHEYEKSRDMAAAALAYKCMEVAYLRVIHCSHSSANRDRHELQTALQMIPTGESPSSSASDIDNLNHPTTVDKVTLGKGISSPQVTGGHIIAARNRTNVSRLLTFAQNVNFAMEASRKSRTAFAAASTSLGDSQSREVITPIKTALDFSFHDVEGLLRLIRLAVEAISR